jgi:RNA recognition motif-containing protein
MNIYVGNLSFEVTEEELRREFAAFGEVITVTMMNDNYIGSGQHKGYAYVDMASLKEAEMAVNSLNGKRLRNQIIEVVRALPLTDKRKEAIHHGNKTSWFGSKFRQRN